MSKKKNSRVWLITGCSTGFGRLLAKAALENGDRVLVTARNPHALNDIVSSYPKTAKSCRLDVRDKESIQGALDMALIEFGRIDVLVNNAGYGFTGAFEEMYDQQIREEFDTNFFGMLNVTRALLPTFRKQAAGHILNFSSVVGRMSFPTMGIYSATKFAIEGASEALAAEIKSFGIKLTLIEPGAFNTDFGKRSLGKAEPMPEYKDLHEKMKERVSAFQYGDLDSAVQAMLDVVELTDPPLRLPLGFGTLTSIVEKLSADIAAYEQVRSLWESSNLQEHLLELQTSKQAEARPS